MAVFDHEGRKRNACCVHRSAVADDVGKDGGPSLQCQVCGYVDDHAFKLMTEDFNKKRV